MIRPYAAQDREAVLDLLRQTCDFSAEEVAIAEELLEIVATRPEQKDYLAYVAGPEVRGMMILGPVPATAGSWHLYWIAVHPAHYGGGIAQELQGFAESLVRERGGYWLIAETSTRESYARARAFYVKCGYAELAQIPDYYRPGDGMILFGKRLG
jgi:ribosomal protein S18 acetylase RimI-like enzyme